MSNASPDPQSGSAQSSESKKSGMKASVKGPLAFSAVLGLVGGLVVLFTATGGVTNPWRWDLGLIAFGVFFIVSLLVVAMLQLSSKENPDHLSKGSGVNRSSEELHRAAVARQRQKLREEQQAQYKKAQEEARKKRQDDDGSHA